MSVCAKPHSTSNGQIWGVQILKCLKNQMKFSTTEQ